MQVERKCLSPVAHVPLLASSITILGGRGTRHVLCQRSLHTAAKTHNLWASLNVRVAPCHPWHRDISPSLDKPNAFLHVLPSALIEAIPLSVLSKLRNFLRLGSPRSNEVWYGLGPCEPVRVITKSSRNQATSQPSQ